MDYKKQLVNKLPILISRDANPTLHLNTEDQIVVCVGDSYHEVYLIIKPDYEPELQQLVKDELEKAYKELIK